MEYGTNREINFNGKTWGLHTITGVVSDSQTRSELTISGGGGSGSVTTNPVTGMVSGGSTTQPIKSTTTNFQNLFLVDKDGKEYLIETVNSLISCHPGQQLTVIAASPKGKDYHFKFATYNHNIGRFFYYNLALRSMSKPGWKLCSALIVANIAICFYSFWTLLFSVPAAIGYWYLVWNKRVNEFKSRKEILSIFADVEKLPIIAGAHKT